MTPLLYVALASIVALLAGCASLGERLSDAPLDAPEVERLEAEGDVDAFDRAERYRRDPIRLQTATVESLMSLPGFRREVAERLLIHLAAANPTSIEDLAGLDWLDSWHLLLLGTYTTLERDDRSNALRFDARSRVLHDIERRRGVRDTLHRVRLHIDARTGDTVARDTIPIGTSWVGSGDDLQVQALARWNGHELAGRISAPRGTPFLYRDTLGFNYADMEEVIERTSTESTTARLTATDRWYLQLASNASRLVVGDYTLDAARGIVLARGDVGRAPVVRRSDDVSGTLSTTTPYRFRGAALDLAPPIEGLKLLLAWSNLERDVFLDDELATLRIRAPEMPRTRQELRAVGMGEELLAARARYTVPGFEAGLTMGSLNYSLEAITLVQRRVLAADLFWRSGRAEFHAELGVDGGTASSAGLRITGPGTVATIDVAWISAGWLWPHGRHRPAEVDRYEALAAITLRPDARVRFEGMLSIDRTMGTLPYVRVRTEERLALRLANELELTGWGTVVVDRDEATSSTPNGTDHRTFVDRYNGRIGGSIETSMRAQRLTLRASIERAWKSLADGSAEASGVRVDLTGRWSPTKWLSLSSRVVRFHGEDGITHWSAFGELPGRVVMKSASGSGAHLMLAATAQLSGSIELSAVYTRTGYDDRKRISAGTSNEIDGPIDQRVGAQLDVGL